MNMMSSIKSVIVAAMALLASVAVAYKDMSFKDFLAKRGCNVIRIGKQDADHYANNFLAIDARHIMSVAHQSRELELEYEANGVKVEWMLTALCSLLRLVVRQSHTTMCARCKDYHRCNPPSTVGHRSTGCEATALRCYSHVATVSSNSMVVMTKTSILNA